MEVAGNHIPQLLQEASEVIQNTIQRQGDGPLLKQDFLWQLEIAGANMMVRIMSQYPKVHPLTLSVVNIALAELWDFMVHNDFGLVRFRIYLEGQIQGTGIIFLG